FHATRIETPVPEYRSPAHEGSQGKSRCVVKERQFDPDFGIDQVAQLRLHGQVTLIPVPAVLIAPHDLAAAHGRQKIEWTLLSLNCTVYRIGAGRPPVWLRAAARSI